VALLRANPEPGSPLLAALGGWEKDPMKLKLAVSEARTEAAALVLRHVRDSVPKRDA